MLCFGLENKFAYLDRRVDNVREAIETGGKVRDMCSRIQCLQKEVEAIKVYLDLQGEDVPPGPTYVMKKKGVK